MYIELTSNEMRALIAKYERERKENKDPESRYSKARANNIRHMQSELLERRRIK